MAKKKIEDIGNEVSSTSKKVIVNGEEKLEVTYADGTIMLFSV